SVQALGSSLSFRLPTLVVWLSFCLRGPGVVSGPGEAQEGFVALEAALPSRLDNQQWIGHRRTCISFTAAPGSERVVIATGQGRKTDATDAHSVALVGTRMTGLRPVGHDEQLAVLRILVDRRRCLGEDHTRMVSQLHQLLLELIPGGAKTALSAAQAKTLLATVRPRDAAGKARRRVAAELISDLERVYQRSRAADKELTELVAATGSTLMDLHGIGPSGAARLLVEIGDIARFPNRDHFASWNGTAPIDASSGDQVRHRLSRAGNRQINRVLHIMATVQLRNPTEGRAYFDKRKADGKTSMEAMRALKRRLSSTAACSTTRPAAR